MTSKKRLTLQIFVLAVLVGATFFCIFRQSDVGEIFGIIRGARTWPLVLAAVSMAFFIFCDGFCVQILFKAMGTRTNIFRCAKYAYIEFFFSAITPSNSGGQPVAALAMREDGYRVTDITAVMLAVTALYKFSLLGLFFGFYAANYSFLHAQVLGMQGLLYLGIASHVLLIGLICVALYSKKLVWSLCAGILKLLCKLRIVKNPEKGMQKLAEQLENYHKCAEFMKNNLWAVVKCFAVATAQRVSLLLVPYLVYLSLGLSGVRVWQMMGLQLLLSVSVEILPLPGGMGVSESVFLVLYEAIFGKKFLYSAVLMCRGISFYLMVPLSGLVVLGVYWAGLRKRRKLMRTT